MSKVVERELRKLLQIIANLPKTGYTHSVVLLYEMLAARNPEIARKLAEERLEKLYRMLTTDEWEKAQNLIEEQLTVEEM